MYCSIKKIYSFIDRDTWLTFCIYILACQKKTFCVSNQVRDSNWSQFVQELEIYITVITLSIPTDRSGQTVQTQIRLFLEEQSDQGLHCLLFH